MPKVKITNAKGLVQSTGTGLQVDSEVTKDLVFAGGVGVKYGVKALTSSTTLASPGVYTVSGSSALTVTMPAVSKVAGGMFTIRAISNKAHVVTGSSSDAGDGNTDPQVNTFVMMATGSVSAAGTLKGRQEAGQKLTFPAVVGASVTMYCDGKQYLVMAMSGSVAATVP